MLGTVSPPLASRGRSSENPDCDPKAADIGSDETQKCYTAKITPGEKQT